MDKIIDGKALAKTILGELETNINAMKSLGLKAPGIKVVLVEGDEPSRLYANQIVKKANKIGMDGELLMFPNDYGTENLLAEIEKLNNDKSVHGYMVQFPLPKSYDSDRIRSAIAKEKDVDSLGHENVGLFYRNKESFVPCTSLSMMELLKSYKSDLAGLKAVVLGRSYVVGRPVFELAVKENMTATICHSKTKNIAEEIKTADVVLSAIGSAGFVKPEMLKDGAIVIDAGINFVDGKITGDVDYDGCIDKVSAITPVPGGVGPVTNAILLRNVYNACIRQLNEA